MPILAAVLLLILLGGRLVLVYSGFGGESGSAARTTAQAASQTGIKADLEKIQALGLFSGSAGSAPSAPAAKVATALNLKLEGVMLASDSRFSRAVIVGNGTRVTLGVGESLPAMEGVSVASIQSDHVMLSNRGLAEALWLDTGPRQDSGLNSTGASVTGNTRPQQPNGEQPPQIQASRNGARVLQELASNRSKGPAAVSASLAQIIAISPAQENGKLTGYLINPGEKFREFVELGFRPNDLVTSVNGLALNDMQNLPALYTLMNEATDVSFSLVREGQPLNLQLSLSGTE